MNLAIPSPSYSSLFHPLLTKTQSVPSKTVELTAASTTNLIRLSLLGPLGLRCKRRSKNGVR